MISVEQCDGNREIIDEPMTGVAAYLNNLCIEGELLSELNMIEYQLGQDYPDQA